MADGFEQLVQRIGELPPPWAYAVIALSAFLEKRTPTFNGR